MITRDELLANGWVEFNSLNANIEIGENLRIWAAHSEDGNIFEYVLIREDDKHNHIIHLPLYEKYSDFESLIALLTGKEQVCEWVEDGDGLMQTTCGDEFSFECEVAAWKPGYDYCPHCGREIVIKE